MIKIGDKEFESNEDLAKWMEDLVARGEKSMAEGKTSVLGYQEVLDAWGDMVEAAIKDGLVEQFVADRFHAALQKEMLKPFPIEALMRHVREGFKLSAPELPKE